MARMIWLVSTLRLQPLVLLDAEVLEDRRAGAADLALVVVVDLEQAVGALDDLHRRLHLVALSAASVTWLIAMPGAISTNSEASTAPARSRARSCR